VGPCHLVSPLHAARPRLRRLTELKMEEASKEAEKWEDAARQKQNLVKKSAGVKKDE